MAKVQIVYWRDIPVQVRVKVGRDRTTRPLDQRFQDAVYRAAYRAKAITGEAYIDEWRPSPWQAAEGEPEAILDRITAELEAAYTNIRLAKIARNKGFEPPSPPDP